jgi:hypothetical protein
MSVRREWKIGAHRAYLEDPDLLVVKFGGKLGLEEARHVVDLYREVATSRPFFLIADITGAELDGDARKHLVEGSSPGWFQGVVYVGASSVMRAVGKAMSVAFYFTGKWKLDFEWANTEAEGRACITRMREKQAARKA